MAFMGTFSWNPGEGYSIYIGMTGLLVFIFRSPNLQFGIFVGVFMENEF